MLKKLRVISILLCGVIFLNGLCIGSASAAYTPRPLMASDEQSIVDKIEDDSNDQNNFESIINEIYQYYQKKDGEGKSREYSKEFNEYCLSVLFKLYHEILGSQFKDTKEGIPNIKEVILTGVRVLGDLNDTTNLSYPTLLYRVLNLELDKNQNKSISQRLDSAISQHMETILRNGRSLLGSSTFEQANFETLPMVTQSNLLRCVEICKKNVGLLLSDEELQKILQQISGLSLEEYQKDLKEMADPTTSSSSSSSSSSSPSCSSSCSTSSSSSTNLTVEDKYEILARTEQGRKYLVNLARKQSQQYSYGKKISALEAVISNFGKF